MGRAPVAKQALNSFIKEAIINSIFMKIATVFKEGGLKGKLGLRGGSESDG